MSTMRRFVFRTLAGVALMFALLAGYVLYPWPLPPAESFALVAHRGVHQTHPGRDEGVNNETCTAELIEPPRHEFIENTIPSIREAFAHGATSVEIDIHRTADGHLVVFHDWTLDCRTNGTGTTNEQTLAYLKSLDLGYGYTADGGQTFPLRGTGVGMMPTLPEVLAAFPDRQFIIHDKDGDAETRRQLVDVLKTLPTEQRARLSYWGSEVAAIQADVPEIQPYVFGERELRSCLGDYLIRMLLLGSLPEHCREQIIGVPYSLLGSLPGWPHLILARAHQAGARVYVVDVDSAAQLAALADLPLDGIQTNRIEVVGPLLRDLRQ
jgi:glycerophosphoryl diester phosphodiesterase